VAELVGAAEIARRFGLAFPNSVHNMRRRDPSFPAPVTQVGQTMVWDWRAVERWAIRTGRIERKRKR
jgi:hypothetical protein